MIIPRNTSNPCTVAAISMAQSRRGGLRGPSAGKAGKTDAGCQEGVTPAKSQTTNSDHRFLHFTPGSLKSPKPFSCRLLQNVQGQGKGSDHEEGLRRIQGRAEGIDRARVQKTRRMCGSRNFDWASLWRAKTAAGTTAATSSRYGRNLAHSNFRSLEILAALNNDGFNS